MPPSRGSTTAEISSPSRNDVSTSRRALMEFSSPTNAVLCAVDLQKKMALANAPLPEGRRIVLRIGISLGDVIVESGDLYGDGVIIAARLEVIAEPGGVLVSGAVFRSSPKQDQGGFRGYRHSSLETYRRAVTHLPHRWPTVGCDAEVAADKPSIAALPFVNMSGDREQNYFSDGITEDIITELSRYRSLLVIARNSSFQFRGSSIDIGVVRRKLGVRFVVEGGIRKSGDRIRVTAQLVDAETRHHVWADHYERGQGDIFAVQDELVRAISATLEGRIAASGADLAKRKPEQHLGAYDFLLRGRGCMNRYDAAAAEPFFRQAIELDPGYAQAHAWQS